MRMIDADALLDAFAAENDAKECQWTLYGIKRKIEDAPRQEQKWIPVISRPLTDEEKEYYEDSFGCDFEDIDYIYDCPLPDDGQTVLITDRLGNVEVDTFCRDDGCYFECNCDAEDVLAWMPLPEPYKAESEDKE